MSPNCSRNLTFRIYSQLQSTTWWETSLVSYGHKSFCFGKQKHHGRVSTRELDINSNTSLSMSLKFPVLYQFHQYNKHNDQHNKFHYIYSICAGPETTWSCISMLHFNVCTWKLCSLNSEQTSIPRTVKAVVVQVSRHLVSGLQVPVWARHPQYFSQMNNWCTCNYYLVHCGLLL